MRDKECEILYNYYYEHLNRGGVREGSSEKKTQRIERESIHVTGCVKSKKKMLAEKTEDQVALLITEGLSEKRTRGEGWKKRL